MFLNQLSYVCSKTKMQETHVFFFFFFVFCFSSLVCNCVKVAATFFKIDEIMKMAHFNINFL